MLSAGGGGQPGHHPGVLTMNITTVATNCVHILKNKHTEPSKRQQNSVVSHLQSPPESSCLILQREAKFSERNEIPSLGLHTAGNNYAHQVQSTTPERTPGHMTSLLFSATSLLSLLGLPVGPPTDFVK